ncbi:cobyric acid synthase [Desulfuromonas versatilis]|uniref:Cobyric acid synthase n=1 Tax=Desulfuromonas versatilis TaxID=2802975 RepID=A0ABM9SDD4_9BACT|nr:cobyric acid synthase [Desulfuromonas versatilis]BCR03748.1 cobyric acid synthase [Desulfuromonas versatilis]
MKNKLYVVGIGPGDLQHMTPAARQAIEAAEVVVGYKTYLGLIDSLLAGKEVVSSGMMKEVERCRQALEIAADGRSVALVSSGDAGIYGMAGLVLELVGEHQGSPLQGVEVEIVPGVSAVQAAAARLGAPLMHDFAVISLSDLLTPWPLIRRRLDAAGRADFVVALYNPRSRGRTTQIGEARQILLAHREPQTPVGIVRNACRADEAVILTTLEELASREEEVDMFSLVMIGNSQTRIEAGRMLTPRGYRVRNQESGIRTQKQCLKPETWNLKSEQGKALFVGGTGSDVGKSVITAGLCRILKRRGLSVAPFKAQNMALNSAVTPEGGEIGRAQALQAAACGIAPHADMNPVLLKPNSETGSQVIIQGRPVGNMGVRQYHAYKDQAFARVRESYARLSGAHDVVVLEGAGSIAEINLREHDITNLRAAEMADAPVLLVADIERGGVFAAIVGTLEVLAPAERARVAGVIINRFRGDASLLRPGIEAVEERTGVPVLGVVPWLDLKLPEEDSLALARKGKGAVPAALRIGVVRLPRISNYTDFDPLEQEPGVELVYLDEPEQVAGLDLLILPGTKSTLADLAELRRRGFERAILAYHAAGGRIAGICGGYQMLGGRIADPGQVESDHGEARGLDLLDVETVLRPAKQTHQASAVPLPAASAAGLGALEEITGYEIHMGETRCGSLARPLLRLTRRSGKEVDMADGAVDQDGQVWGTYLHGLFDSAPFRRALLAPLFRAKGLEPPDSTPGASLDARLDELADHLEAHLDLERILSLLDRRTREDCSWNG